MPPWCCHDVVIEFCHYWAKSEMVTMRWMSIAIAATLSAVSGSAMAQVVIQADTAMLQPQIGRDEAGFNNCGVRAVVLVTIGKVVDVYDFSIGMMAGAFGGVMKAGKSRTALKDIQAGKNNSKVVTPPPTKFWIAKESDGAALMPKQVLPAENEGFILEVADFVKTHDIIEALMLGERMHFAVRYKDQSVDNVIAFSAKMTDEEVQPLFNCISGVAQRSLKILEEKR